VIIDAHMHALFGRPGKENLPERYRRILAMLWAYGGPPPYDRDPEAFLERVEPRMSDPDGTYTIATLDQGGVDGAVIIPSDYGLAVGEDQPMTLDEIHQGVAALQERYPNRLFGFSGGDARRPNAFRDFERAVTEYGLKGYKVMPHLGYYASDRMLYPYYERCQELGIPVAICTNMEWTTCRTRFNEPLHIGDVLVDFPDLNVIIFHVGFPIPSWFEQCLMLSVASINVYLQFDAWIYPSFGPQQQGFMHAMNNEQMVISMLDRARKITGAHRILFGTDNNCGPSMHSEKLYDGRGMGWIVDWWRSLPERAAKYDITFTQQEVELMLGKNMGRLLGVIDMPEYQRKHKYNFPVRTPGPRPMTSG
jgi:predicted TIM-barrel fold metal-dependent hydrolase